MSKRPFVSRFIDTSNQLLLRYRQRRQVRPDYAVPAGAQPGDIHLEPATFRTRTYEVPAEQGYLIVAEDPQAPTGRLLSLPIIRTEAEVADPGLPVYWFTTGPGSSNMLAAPPDWLLRRHPITILGYRGVDGTVRLDSPEIVRAQKGQGHDLHSAASLAAFRQAVAAAVARWQPDPLPQPDTLPEPGLLPPHTILPYRRNQDFVGRETDLLQLGEWLLPWQEIEESGGLRESLWQSPITAAAITGMGGLGKTQLAVEFAYRYGRFYAGGVYWISFAQAENVAGEIAALGGERGRLPGS